MPFSSSELLNYLFETKEFHLTINIKHDKKCKEYLNVQAEPSATGRVVRYVRAELSATGRAVHGPSCPGIEQTIFTLYYTQKGFSVHLNLRTRNFTKMGEGLLGGRTTRPVDSSARNGQLGPYVPDNSARRFNYTECLSRE